MVDGWDKMKWMVSWRAPRGGWPYSARRSFHHLLFKCLAIYRAPGESASVRSRWKLVVISEDSLHGRRLLLDQRCMKLACNETSTKLYLHKSSFSFDMWYLINLLNIRNNDDINNNVNNDNHQHYSTIQEVANGAEGDHEPFQQVRGWWWGWG